MLLSYLRSILSFNGIRFLTGGYFYKVPQQSISTVPTTTNYSMDKMEEYVTVSYVTAPNEEVANKLGRRIVQHRLAACVNIIKTVDSIYEWEGELVHDSEAMLIIKSHSSKSKELVKFIEKHHVYSCPEVVTVKIENGSKKYLDWVVETIEKPPFGPDSPSESPSV